MCNFAAVGITPPFRHFCNNTMNNKDFIASLSKASGMSRERTQSMVTAVIAAMSDTFDGGDSVAIAGFGTFEPKKRMERVMVSPTTGQRMLVPPKVVLTFKAAAATKNTARKGGDEA